MLQNNPGDVPMVNDRRVLKGIFWILRSGSPWRDFKELRGPCTTCSTTSGAGVWDQLVDAITGGYGGDVRMFYDTSVHVHHSTATSKKATRIAVLEKAGEVLVQKSKL